MTRRTYRRRRGGDIRDPGATAARAERQLRLANFDRRESEKAAARENMMAEARAQAPTKGPAADPVSAALWGKARGSALSQLEKFVQDRGPRRSPAGFLRPGGPGEELNVR